MTTMKAPSDGVTVRMYRYGHGDCFLLTFPRDGGGDPVFVLIDCGYKPGSQNFLPHNKSVDEFVKHIGEATDYRLDLVIITHEHQDHVNCIWRATKPYFDDFTIQEAWFAWTEDPDDQTAIDLRKKHNDQLLTLLESRKQLALALGAYHSSVKRLDDLLSLETGATDIVEMLAAAKSPEASINKQGMRLVKTKAAQKRGVKYLSPGKQPTSIVGTGVRAFVLGPPRSDKLLGDEDPVGSEGFPREKDNSLDMTLAAALGVQTTGAGIETRPRELPPFRKSFCLTKVQTAENPFFAEYIGQDGLVEDDSSKEVPKNASWRQIDNEWLFSAETLALKMNRGINNTSLVLAFELPKTKKVLLFVGDAQRGNWISWTDCTWKDGDKEVNVQDLLARTVLYKVGHHGSHNATLSGSTADKYANLNWMGMGAAAGEFTSMITAVNEWAVTKNVPPWYHPLKSIRKALDEKCHGRVFQTDKDPEKPLLGDDASWSEFNSRTLIDPLFFDYTIKDK